MRHILRMWRMTHGVGLRIGYCVAVIANQLLI
jgi:hypothetical protein